MANIEEAINLKKGMLALQNQALASPFIPLTQDRINKIMAEIEKTTKEIEILTRDPDGDAAKQILTEYDTVHNGSKERKLDASEKKRGGGAKSRRKQKKSKRRQSKRNRRTKRRRRIFLRVK